MHIEKWGVVIAAGLLGWALCAAAMGLSDIIVIGNALRLRAWRFSAPRQNRS